MKTEISRDSNSSKKLISYLLLIVGLSALIISIFQFTNSNIKYGMLSLCFTSVFFSGLLHNRVLRHIESEFSSKKIDEIMYSTLIVGIFIGITIAYLIIEVII